MEPFDVAVAFRMMIRRAAMRDAKSRQHLHEARRSKSLPIAKAWLESSVSAKVSRIWKFDDEFFVSCQLTMDRDDKTIV